MGELLRQPYRTYQRGLPPHCREPTSRLQGHVAPKTASHYLLFLQEEWDDVLAALQRHGMGVVSQDIVESVNRILKVGYKDHSERGGGCSEHPTLWAARVVAPVWELWFLHFDLPLHTRGDRHRTSCVVSTLMEPFVQPPPPFGMPRSPPPPAFL